MGGGLPPPYLEIKGEIFMAKKVKVTNNVNQHITLFDRSLNFEMVFERKGVSRFIDLDILQQMIYNAGVEVIFKEGLLIIEDMEDKIALGLEPEGAKEPVNIITLNDAQKKRHLTVSPMKEFKELIDKMPLEQVKELARFAIANELVGNMEKVDYLQSKTNINILKAIQTIREEKMDK